MQYLFTKAGLFACKLTLVAMAPGIVLGSAINGAFKTALDILETVRKPFNHADN